METTKDKIQALSNESKVLLSFHIMTVESTILGYQPHDDNGYCRKRDEIAFAAATSPMVAQRVIGPYEGNAHFGHYSQNIKALAKSLRNNEQRRLCKQLLWNYIDAMEFDYLDSNFQNDNIVYNYKWDIVNRELADRLFGIF